MFRKIKLGLCYAYGVLFITATSFTSWASPFAYIGGQTGNLYVVDVRTRSLVKEIPMGSVCVGIGTAVHPKGTKVYVSSSCVDEKLSVIDASTNQISKEIPLDGLGGIAMSPDGNRIYVTTKSSVVVIDTITDTEVLSIPMGGTACNANGGLSINADGSKLYATNYCDKTVTIIDTQSNQVIDPPIQIPAASLMALVPSKNKAYATGDNSVSVIDIQSGQLLSSIQIGDDTTNTLGIVASADGSKIYVTTSIPEDSVGNALVYVIDTQTESVIATLDPGDDEADLLFGVDLTPDGNELWVASYYTNSVYIFDTATGKRVGEIDSLILPIAFGRFIGPATTEIAEDCDNGNDDDGDSKVDCEDSNCSADIYCKDNSSSPKDDTAGSCSIAANASPKNFLGTALGFLAILLLQAVRRSHL